MRNHIALIGPRYSGKSTLAQPLADLLGWSVLSSDNWIVSQTGQNIQTIVQAHGWGYFRQLELEFLLDFCKKKGRLQSWIAEVGFFLKPVIQSTIGKKKKILNEAVREKYLS